LCRLCHFRWSAADSLPQKCQDMINTRVRQATWHTTIPRSATATTL
jgi:hypothetical protein